MSLTSEEVSEVLFDTVQSAKYPGGTIMEISKLGTRVIPEWRIAPVGEIDGKMAEGSDSPVEAIERVIGSIAAVTDGERATDVKGVEQPLEDKGVTENSSSLVTVDHDLHLVSGLELNHIEPVRSS